MPDPNVPDLFFLNPVLILAAVFGLGITAFVGYLLQRPRRQQQPRRSPSGGNAATSSGRWPIEGASRTPTRQEALEDPENHEAHQALYAASPWIPFPDTRSVIEADVNRLSLVLHEAVSQLASPSVAPEVIFGGLERNLELEHQFKGAKGEIRLIDQRFVVEILCFPYGFVDLSRNMSFKIGDERISLIQEGGQATIDHAIRVIGSVLVQRASECEQVATSKFDPVLAAEWRSIGARITRFVDDLG